MSELKEYLCVEALVPEIKEIPGYLMHMAKYRAPQAEMALAVYLKSEADKVIADLEESHKKEVEQLLMEIMNLKHSLELASNECCSISERGVKNARHHKYKRCLAMANYWVAVSYHCADDKHRQKAEKHHYKWMELAEKFKEEK